MAQDTPKSSGSASPHKQRDQRDKQSSLSHKVADAIAISDGNTLTKKKSLVPAVFQKTLQSQTLKKHSKQRQEGMKLIFNTVTYACMYYLHIGIINF